MPCTTKTSRSPTGRSLTRKHTIRTISLDTDGDSEVAHNNIGNELLAFMNKHNHVEQFYLTEPRLTELVKSCKTELKAVQVWLFGSRARGDHHKYSDWDLLAVIQDDAPERFENPGTLYELRRKSGVHADLLAVRYSDFISALDVVNTISYAVKREGIRLDV